MSISTAGCQATIPPFVGRPGLYIEGSVSPALSGVDIRIVAAGESVNAPLLKGELALETKTGVDGSFIGGPLYDDTNYRVDASKVCVIFLYKLLVNGCLIYFISLKRQNDCLT